ncbi:MAG TPA: hypothetical protein VF767_09410 [Bryobacteraceae bacterium]
MRTHGIRVLKRLLVPSYSDWLFVALLAWLFVAGAGWSVLLADGDTGWHIRAGEFVLDTGAAPRRDLFSYSKAGAPWYAWEWLADVLLALAWRAAALKGVVLLAGLLIASSLLLLFRYMLWRGANLFFAMAACLAVAAASSIHYLARPHIFTLLLFPLSLWILDRDRRRGGRAVWLLIPLTALWTNLHGGFLALVVSVGALAAAALFERNLRRAWRYVALAAGCGTASLANPYGFALHAHVFEYLRSDWIRDAVDEFQSPRFRSESAVYLEILLFAGIATSALLLRRGNFSEAVLVLLWAHAALVSVRHVPMFALVAAPVAVSEATRLWNTWARGSPARSIRSILDRLATDLAAGARRTSLLPLGVALVLAFAAIPFGWPLDFPAAQFPLGLIGRHESLLASARVFTSDQWGDYFIYRFHARQRVFMDGRSDFYGPEIGKLYLRILYGDPKGREALDRYGVSVVLAARSWPLAHQLRANEGWRVVEEDSSAVLFARSGLAPAPEAQPKEMPSARRTMPQELLRHEYRKSAPAAPPAAPALAAGG